MVKTGIGMQFNQFEWQPDTTGPLFH